MATAGDASTNPAPAHAGDEPAGDEPVDGAPAGTVRFDHGVSSSDPTAGGVSLWTRASGVSGPVALAWTVATDAACTRPVRQGTVQVDERSDHCARVRVEDLPAGPLHYRFSAGAVHSPVGRTATIPATAERYRIGIVSCARYGSGYFHAYRLLAREAPDLVVHLGDYLYEDGGRCVPGREHDPGHRLRSAEDYRRRYRQQRSDPDLQALHATAPWLALWDDHEVADNLWGRGAAGHRDERDGAFADRVANAHDAAACWAVPDPARGGGHLDRRVSIGSLADLWLVDSRHRGRDAPVDRSGGPSRQPIDDRRMLSPEQRRELADGLRAGTGRWRLVANQVQISPLRLGYLPARHRPIVRAVINPDQWDGYPAERRALLDALGDTTATLALSGDLHATFLTATEGPRGRLLELTTPAVTAPTMGTQVRRRLGLPSLLITALLRTLNRHIHRCDLTRHGFSLLTVEADRITVEVHLLRGVDRPQDCERRVLRAELHHADRPARWRSAG
ncbi:MAG: alkaline phosphatase [Acidimicrobiia bacterium]